MATAQPTGSTWGRAGTPDGRTIVVYKPSPKQTKCFHFYRPLKAFFFPRSLVQSLDHFEDVHDLSDESSMLLKCLSTLFKFHTVFLLINQQPRLFL